MYATSRINTQQADAFRVEFSQIIIDNVQKSVVTPEQWRQMVEDMERMRASEEKMAQRLESLQRDVDAARVSAQTAASAAGVALAAQKGTRHLRLVK